MTTTAWRCPYPVTRWLYVVWLVAGVVVLSGAFWEGWTPAAALLGLPDWADGAIGSAIAAGATLCLVGSTPQKYITAAWTLERTGCLLAATGWSAYMLASLTLSPMMIVNAWFGLGFVIGGIVRWRDLGRRWRATAANLGRA